MTARTCGDCQACCVALGVRELDKQPCHICPNQSADGCAIYTNRPETCRVYACNWLGGFGKRRDRPDRLGLIVDQVKPGHVRARETAPGTFNRKRVRQLLRELHASGLTVQLIPFGGRRLPVGVAL